MEKDIAALKNEIGALKHLLKGGNSTTVLEDIRESVLIYESSDKATLLCSCVLWCDKATIQSFSDSVHRGKCFPGRYDQKGIPCFGRFCLPNISRNI